MSRARLRLAGDEFQPDFGPGGALRQTFGESGRVHMDRWLPFIVLHCGDPDQADIGRRVAVNSPAYLLWSPGEAHLASSALAAIEDRVCAQLGQFLPITVADLTPEPTSPKSAELPPFEFRIAGSGGAAARAAAEALAQSAREICIDLRSPEVHCEFEPGAGDRLAIGMSPIHRGPDGQLYPQLAHELTAAVVDLVLRSAAAFLAAGKGKAPGHYRELGRSAVVAAALNADRKLDAICSGFDFLLSVSPINSAEAYRQFVAGGEADEPEFHYRPLTIDPDVAKRDLYAIDLSIVEDPLLEQLLSEKRREIDAQLTLLATRNTPAFKAASTMLYGGVEPQLLADAHALLAAVPPARAAGETVDSGEVAARAEELIALYRASDPRFAAEVEVRDDVAGLLVSSGRLFVAGNTRIRRSRIDPLLAHEVSVHLLTWCNGSAQPLTIFRTGLAGYEGVQEGLGVFAEWAVGGLTAARMRLLAGRVVAVEAMLDGAGFLDVYRRLTREFDFAAKSAFDITMRVFRSGGLAKDAIYLRGFRQVVDHVASGAPLDPFWLGKIAPGHVPAVEELLRRNLLHAPVFVPEFLSRPDALERIERLRAGIAFDQLISLE